MAPGTRRANRGGYTEHDDFEGLPVRQWRHDWVNVAPPPQQEQPQQNDIWAVELIHGMPKDAHLIPPHSQELLLAARSGRLYKRPVPIEEEEADPETILPDKPEKKEDSGAKGFSVKVWKQIPRNIEGQNISHLAKRRKNTITIASKTVDENAKGPTVTRATVRRVDAAGNPYTEEVTLGEGQQVKGQIIATRIEAVAPGIGPEVVTRTPPSQKRRPPPFKRKNKAGPGRGKKKIKFPLSGAEGSGNPAAAANGIAPTDPAKFEQTDQSAIKQEGEDTHQDSEMADGDGDDDDDDDEGDDGEEGEEGDEGDETQTPGDTSDVPQTQDHEMTDATFAANSPIVEKPDADVTDPELSPSRAIPPNPLNLAPPAIAFASASPKLEGSPLKQVVLPSPTTEVPPEISPLGTETVLPALAPPDVPTAPTSTIAEPPTTIVGEAPETAAERDVPKLEPTEEAALLPPPPEQVGNIATTPTSEAPSTRFPDVEEKSNEEVQPGEEALPEPGRPSLLHKDTEDTIRPDDSVSISFPLTEPAAPSVIAPAVTEEVKDEFMEEAEEEAEPAQAEPIQTVTQASPSKEEPIVPLEPAPVTQVEEPTAAEPEVLPTKEASPPVEEAAAPVQDVSLPAEKAPVAAEEAEAPAPIEEPDLLGGLMGELDRQSAETRDTTVVKPESAPEPAPAPAPEQVSEQVSESVPDPIPEPASDSVPVAEPPKSPASDPAPEPVVKPETVVEAAVVAPLEEATVSEAPAASTAAEEIATEQPPQPPTDDKVVDNVEDKPADA